MKDVTLSSTSKFYNILAKRSEVLQLDKMGNVLESPEKQTPKEGKFHGGFLAYPLHYPPEEDSSQALLKMLTLLRNVSALGLLNFKTSLWYMTNERVPKH
jgi:hypothetical protein